MSQSSVLLHEICEKASAYPDTNTGESCNQYSFSVGKRKFLFVGPGAKGVGLKAMFKLKDSMPEALKLSKEEPKRFEVGKTGWVTARFSDEHPIPAELFDAWLQESYELSAG